MEENNQSSTNGLSVLTLPTTIQSNSALSQVRGQFTPMHEHQDVIHDIEEMLIPQATSSQHAVTPIPSGHAESSNPITLMQAAVPLRKSQRTKKSALSNDYMTYLNEVEYDFGDVDDPTTYNAAIESPQASLWHAAMQDELN
ncbi:hypothetical protein ACFX13_000776 [Malus domestica]